MSGYVSGAVWNTRLPDKGMKSVLASIADNANDEGFGWPSVDFIAQRTQYSRRSVLEALEQLESGGWIEKMQSPRSHRHNAYQIVLDKLCWDKPKASALTLKRRKKAQAELEFSGAIERNPQVQSVQSHVQSTHSHVQSTHSQVQSTHSQVQSTPPYIEEPSRTVSEPPEEPSSEHARANLAPITGIVLSPLHRPSSLELAIQGGRAAPVNPPPEAPDLADLILGIACSHPKALARQWSPRDVPHSVQAAIFEAIQAEEERAGCSQSQAAEMILDRIRMLAEKIPKAEWRFLKRPDEFFRAREYRLEPEEFTRAEAPKPEARRSFADEQSEREEQEIRRVREQRSGKRDGSSEIDLRPLAEPRDNR